MKNQYFGDINDYHKYALLRGLLFGGIKLKLLVAWMLTKDDNSSDGQKRHHLEKSDKWWPLDPELYEFLLTFHGSGVPPAVSVIENDSKILPNVVFYSEIVKDDPASRNSWLEGLKKEASGVDLVFLDPDNGIQVDSKPMGKKDSSKYVAWEEIQSLWNAGNSLLIYQHGRREQHQETAKELMTKLWDATKSPLVMGFWTGGVFFFLVSQERHNDLFRERLSKIIGKWGNDIFEFERDTSPLKPNMSGPKPYTPEWDPDDSFLRGVSQALWNKKVRVLDKISNKSAFQKYCEAGRKTQEKYRKDHPEVQAEIDKYNKEHPFKPNVDLRDEITRALTEDRPETENKE